MIIEGTATWAKIVGEPAPNKFNPKSRRWSFDFTPNAKGKEDLLKAGMKPSYLKNKGDKRGDFLQFTRDETKSDGTKGKPFIVIDSKKNLWPEDVKIGNGSTLRVKVSLNERSFRGEKFLKPSALAIQVWDHVKYEGDGFEVKETNEDDSENDQPEDFSDSVEDIGSEDPTSSTKHSKGRKASGEW